MKVEIPSYHSPAAVRDRMVSLCGRVEDMHALDVGCGDGLLGRSLLPHVGPHGSVAFVDNDHDVVENLKRDLETDNRANVHVDDACTLRTIGSETIDLVVMRAILLYLPDKTAALRSAARVLGPNGRLIVSEPVNRPLYEPPERLWGFDLSGIPAIATKIQRGFTELATPAVRAMSNWEDTDLARLIAESGFIDIRMETVTEITPGPPVPWLAFLYSKWTKWMPSLAEVTRAHLSEEERDVFERVARPQLAAGKQQLIIRNTITTGRRQGTRSRAGQS